MDAQWQWRSTRQMLYGTSHVPVSKLPWGFFKLVNGLFNWVSVGITEADDVVKLYLKKSGLSFNKYLFLNLLFVFGQLNTTYYFMFFDKWQWCNDLWGVLIQEHNGVGGGNSIMCCENHHLHLIYYFLKSRHLPVLYCLLYQIMFT